MLLSYRWLTRTMGFELPLDELTHRMTMAGIEVEGVRDIGAGHGRVIVARILEVAPHPNADSLTLCQVDGGAAAPYRIVCGAKNMGPGDMVPLAIEGALLPNGLKIKKSKIRGEASEGMMCSGGEIGWGDDADGLLILPQDSWYQVGQPFDAIIDIKVTPNRPDCLSIRGIARDLAAVCSRPAPPPGTLPLEENPADPAATHARVEVTAPELCPLYAGRVIRGVTIAPSPLWLRRAVESAGLRSINNVVDVTNYILLEWGQPLHAFDLDKVAGGAVSIREARAGEKAATLDGQEITLEPGDLLIADAEKPIALAGIMGCANSEITDATTNVFLECAYFQPAAVRRTSRRLGKVTDSSYRFERGTDWAAVDTVVDHAAALIASVAGGTVCSGRVTAGPGVQPAPPIALSGERLRALMGFDIPDETIASSLTALGFSLTPSAPSAWSVVPPSWRPDCSMDADLVEEVARVVGYDRIPPAMPLIRSRAAEESPTRALAATVRSVMTRLGFSEAVNYSFLRAATLEKCGCDSSIRLANPLSAEYAALRSALLPGLLETLAYNQNRGTNDAALFEIGVVFGRHGDGASGPEPHGGLPPCAERTEFAAVITGQTGGLGWRRAGQTADFHDACAAAGEVLRTAGITAAAAVAPSEAHLKAAPHLSTIFHPGKCAVLEVAGRAVAWAGDIHPALQEAFGLKRPAAAAFGCFTAIAAAAATAAPRAFTPPPALPGVARDLAILAATAVPAADISAIIARRAKSLLVSMELFDVYEGDRLPADKRSLAYRLHLHGGDRTLTDDEVNGLMEKIVEDLRAKAGAELR